VSQFGERRVVGHFGVVGEMALIVIPARVAAAREPVLSPAKEIPDSEIGILRAPDNADARE
jgi:hypothetical protein